MNEPVLQLRGVTRHYTQAGKTLRVLEQVNLALRAGTVTALVGPSGSGKTTLLQIAGLLDTPSAGEVLLLGRDMARAGDAERTQARRSAIGFVYQFHHLLPEFSALENVMMPLLIAGMSKTTATARAGELLAAMKLEERLTHRPAQMSGGEQQRVAIARALAAKPKLLLADEPTGNLDPATAEDVFTLLINLARQEGVAALIATHNMELARRMDAQLRMHAGTAVAE